MLGNGIDRHVPTKDMFARGTGWQDIQLERSQAYDDGEIVSQYDGLALFRLTDQQSEYNARLLTAGKAEPPNVLGCAA